MTPSAWQTSSPRTTPALSRCTQGAASVVVHRSPRIGRQFSRQYLTSPPRWSASVFSARAGAPAGESTSLAHGPKAFLGVHPLIFGCHDEQLVSRLNSLPAIGVERVLLSDD